MLSHLIAIFLFISPVAAWAQAPTPQTKQKPCRQHPHVIGKCFTVRGRLSVYNGAPALRIWRVGTKRVLGVSEQRFSVAGYRSIPEDIQEKVNQDVELYGDFLVCPFTPSRRGVMQLVCIESGKNLEVRKRE